MIKHLFLILASILPILIGQVRDKDGHPVQLKISVKDTKLRTASDENGRFYLKEVPDSGVLVLRYGGKKTEVEILGRDKIKIKLLENLVDYFFPLPPNEVLEAAIITAEAGSTKINTGLDEVDQDNYAGSSAIIRGRDLTKYGFSSLSDALRGRAAGVQITDSGQVIIRGISTLNGSPYALLLCDGFEIESLDEVMIEDVENVYFLKEGDIYGQRGANGVVVIVTK